MGHVTYYVSCSVRHLTESAFAWFVALFVLINDNRCYELKIIHVLQNLLFAI